MSTTITEIDQNEIQVVINGKDFEQISKIAREYGVEHPSEIIAFALEIMQHSHGRPIAITEPSGYTTSFMPKKASITGSHKKRIKDGRISTVTFFVWMIIIELIIIGYFIYGFYN